MRLFGPSEGGESEAVCEDEWRFELGRYATAGSGPAPDFDRCVADGNSSERISSGYGR